MDGLKLDNAEEKRIYDSTGTLIRRTRIGGWLLRIKTSSQGLTGVPFTDVVNVLIFLLAIVTLAMTMLGIFIAFKAYQGANDTAKEQLDLLAEGRRSLHGLDASAKEQGALLVDAGHSIKNASEFLQSSARASIQSAATLDADRTDEIKRLMAKPDVVLTLSIVNDGGLVKPLEMADSSGVHILDNDKEEWKSTPGQRDVKMRLTVSNHANVVMRYGELTIRCSALDGFADPVIGTKEELDNAEKMREATESLGQLLLHLEKTDPPDNNPETEKLMHNSMEKTAYMMNIVRALEKSQFSTDIRDLPEKRFASEFVFNFIVRVQRPPELKTRRFQVTVEFAGRADGRALTANMEF